MDDDNGRGDRRRELRLVHPNERAAERLTGEDVLRDGARMMARYLRRRLREIPAEDPDYASIEADASRFAQLAATRSPRTLPG